MVLYISSDMEKRLMGVGACTQSTLVSFPWTKRTLHEIKDELRSGVICAANAFMNAGARQS